MVGKVYCVLTFFLGLWNEFTDEVKHFLCFSTIYSYNLKNKKKMYMHNDFQANSMHFIDKQVKCLSIVHLKWKHVHVRIQNLKEQ